MSALTPMYQPGQASSRFFRFCACALQQPTRRHQSSYRRTRQRLNIKPDASFLPSKTEPHDHIIYNPPPSTPNVYHTPSIFLPKSDRRKQLQKSLAGPQSQSSPSSSHQTTELAPPVRPPYEKKYHVTPEEMDEMRELRKEDPYKWSIAQLAKKYDCSTIFVGWVVEGLAKEKTKEQKLVTEIIKSRWGSKRRIAREDRAIRKERWYKDA